MKIHIEKQNHKRSILLPTNFLLSKSMVKVGMFLIKDSEINKEAAYAICEELRRIKKKYGTWELIDLRSVDGERITITL